MGSKSQYLSVGTVLNSRYRIVRFIKSGGFGNTYEAEDVNFDGMKVVIKELFIGEWCSRGDDSVSVVVSVEQNRQNFSRHIAKFKKEATILRQLFHTRIVRVIDVFEANGTAYYAMDYIDGESLAMRLKALNGRAMMESEVRKYLDQILEALEYVHSKHCYHLDLKPGNIMVNSRGEISLIDFGASKNIVDENGKSLSLSSLLACTPGFAPSEQLDGDMKNLGTHTDMYSLGATLYNLLTGEVPPTPSDILNSDLPEIKGISKSLQIAIIGLMQPSIKLRIKTVAELRKVLSTQSEGGGTTGGNDSGDGGTTLRDKKKKASWSTWLKQNQANIVKLLGGIIITGLVAIGISRCDGFGGGEAPDPNPDTTIVADSAVAISDSISVIDIPEEVETDSDADRLAEQQRQQEAEEARRKAEAEAEAKRQQEAEAARLAEQQRRQEEEEHRQSQGGISTSKEVDLGLSVNWAGWNVGASSPEGYGSLFAWGETSPKSGDYVESTYRHHDGSSYINIGSDISGTQYDAARANWGGSWRMPTKAECQELVNRCTWTWTTYNGVNGMKVTGPNGKSIFLPAPGWRGSTLNNRGINGRYWSGSLDESNSSHAWYLYFISSGSNVDDNYREGGRSVRPVKAR